MASTLRHGLVLLTLFCFSHIALCPRPADTRPARLVDLDDILLDLISDLSVRKVSLLCKSLLRRPPHEISLVKELADLGGKYEQNQERALHRLVNHKPWRRLLPRIYEFDNYIARGQEGVGCRRCKSSVLLPHEVFGTIWDAAPDLFDYLFKGTDENIRTFWTETQQRSTAWHDSHPAVIRQPDASKRIPIGTHGDDTGYHQHDKVLIISWNSVAVNLDTINNKILFAAIQLLPAVAGITLNEYYMVLKWSLNCLNQGKYPAQELKR
jgi:hypothetical protein